MAYSTWITVVILELIHAKHPDFLEGVQMLVTNLMGSPLFGDSGHFDDRMASCRRPISQVSALSTLDGSVLDYHGYNG